MKLETSRPKARNIVLVQYNHVHAVDLSSRRVHGNGIPDSEEGELIGNEMLTIVTVRFANYVVGERKCDITRQSCWLK